MRKPRGSIKPQRNFFLRDTTLVAREILGHYLCVESSGKTLTGRIVETEAYMFRDDPACHASRGMTDRNCTMFERGGVAYVYFIYGVHYCLNVVCGPAGEGTAVLIRSVKPIDGLDEMHRNRPGIKDDVNLANGPGKLTQAFGITGEDNGTDLSTGRIRIFLDPDVMRNKPEVVVAKRVGIVKGSEKPFRFYIKGNPYISRK